MKRKFKISPVKAAIFVTLPILGFAIGLNAGNFMDYFIAFRQKRELKSKEAQFELISEQVLPQDGFVLPIPWGDVGPQLIALGVIKKEEFEGAMNLTEEQKKVLTEGSDEPIRIDGQNSRFIVNMLWALGLAQESLVYSQGPMGQEYKDKVGNFASTGGWNLSQGPAINYLGKHNLISLDEEGQKRVGEIAQNVYRPCCGNSTWFPDCNHGMAALAAIELMVAADLSDEEIYENLLKLNSFWFPHTYLTTALHFSNEGINWSEIDAKLVLGQNYSSAQGAADIAQKVGPLPGAKNVGGSCST